MMNDPICHRLRELMWRRKLTAAEEAELRAWLETHPAARKDWEAEAGLAAALERLPDTAVPNNFTARVLQAVEREAAAARRRTGGGLWRRLGWLPRAAVATGVLGVGLIACHQMQSVERKKLAESVIAVADIPSLPSPDILQDFDAIRASYPAAAPDEQLLALLK